MSQLAIIVLLSEDWIPIDGPGEDEPEIVDGEDLVARVERHVHQHVALAMGAGLIPVPIADAVAVAAVQTEMILRMAHFYGHKPKDQALKSIITGVAGGGTTTGLASLVKLIPGVGTITGGVAQMIIAGSTTYALGKAFHGHFIAGGTLNDITVIYLRSKMKEFLKEGVSVSNRLRPAALSRRVGRSDRIGDLERLADLRDRGVLTEDEFQREKTKILK